MKSIAKYFFYNTIELSEKTKIQQITCKKGAYAKVSRSLLVMFFYFFRINKNLKKGY